MRSPARFAPSPWASFGLKPRGPAASGVGGSASHRRDRAYGTQSVSAKPSGRWPETGERLTRRAAPHRAAGLAAINLTGDCAWSDVPPRDKDGYRRLRGVQGSRNRSDLIADRAYRAILPVLCSGPWSLRSASFPWRGAGAEVQKLLATVDIRGLTSATLLTLFVLPTLYALWGRREMPVSQTDHAEDPLPQSAAMPA